MGQRNPGGEHFEHPLGIDADTVLRVRIGAQLEKVEEIVQIGLPLPLRVHVEGQVLCARARGQAAAARIVRGRLLGVVQEGEDNRHERAPHRRGARRERRPFPHRPATRPALAVGGGLRREVLGRGEVEFPVENGVPREYSFTLAMRWRIHCRATKIGSFTWNLIAHI